MYLYLPTKCLIGRTAKAEGHFGTISTKTAKEKAFHAQDNQNLHEICLENINNVKLTREA